MLTIEKMIQKDGFYMTAAEGVSMLPLIRPKVDTVVIEAWKCACKPMDIVLYRVPNGKLVLHRVIKKRENGYLICGDNCTLVEHVDPSWILGRLTYFYHDERKVNLHSIRYRIYVLLWCRPYQFRIFLLRIKHKARHILKTIVGGIVRSEARK